MESKRRRISDPERDAQAVAVGASMDDHAGCDVCGIPRLIGAEQRAEHLNGKKHRAKMHRAKMERLGKYRQRSKGFTASPGRSPAGAPSPRGPLLTVL